MIHYSTQDFARDTMKLVELISDANPGYSAIYPVPRGGITLGTALSEKLKLPITLTPHPGTLVVDDVVDSGKTRACFQSYDFACLHVKDYTKGMFYPTYYVSIVDSWVSYWWETLSKEAPAEDAVTRLIQSTGEDPNREGLIDTPKRFVKAWQFLLAGYHQKAEDIITTFDSDGYNQIVLLKDIEMYSMCEHHCLPFIGQAHIAYIPRKKIIGISKLARLVELYSRRLQIQERIGDQITEDLMHYLEPQGAACIIEAQHLCMRMRGVEKQNSVMVTSSLKGCFLDDDSSAKNELMLLIK